MLIEIESNTHTDFDSRCEREVELKVTDGILTLVADERVLIAVRIVADKLLEFL